MGQASNVQLGTNPKDRLGVAKVSTTKLPAAGVIHGACAMMDGGFKYEPYNWRGNKVIASIYIDAIGRHLMAWFDESQECAPDSGVHHLGHIIANCSILLDAQETGNLVDDRPTPGSATKILKRLETWVKQRAERAQREKAEKQLREVANETPVVTPTIRTRR